MYIINRVLYGNQNKLYRYYQTVKRNLRLYYQSGLIRINIDIGLISLNLLKRFSCADVFNIGNLQLQIHKKLCCIKFDVPAMRRLHLNNEDPSEYSNKYGQYSTDYSSCADRNGSSTGTSCNFRGRCQSKGWHVDTETRLLSTVTAFDFSRTY